MRPLPAWYRLMESNRFADFSAVKRTFGAADYLAPYTIFDVGGNKYRVSDRHYRAMVKFMNELLGDVGDRESHPLAGLLDIVTTFVHDYIERETPYQRATSKRACETLWSLAGSFHLIVTG